MPLTAFKIKPKPGDRLLLFLTVAITLFGLLMVYDASIIEANRIFNDKYHFVSQQSLWAIFGFIGLFIFSRLPLSWLAKLALPGLIFSLVLLVAVLMPGIGQSSLGARRWLNLFGFTLQPTELVKLTLSLYLAAWMAKKHHLWPFLALISLILGLIMLQPDLGTAIVVIFTALLTYFISGTNLVHLLSLILLGAVAGGGLIWASPYRRDRLLTFLNPGRDPLGSSYHIQQALIAIGSGGFWGLGLGQSRQKYEFLPQVSTDSIFAIIAEEVGFFGAALLILALFLLIFRALRIASLAPDEFSRLLASAIAGWLGIQTVINLSAMLALLPLTGVPLPFISYGGSSLVVNLAAVGILLNISRTCTNPKKKYASA